MPRETARPERPANRAAELRQKLRIDEDNIDRCLVEQPEYFYMAAEAVALAIANRDTLKLQLAELTAELDLDLRRQFAANEEKYSETSLSNRLKTLPRIQTAHRAYLDASRLADEAEALKDSYQQRSYMLRELNASANAKLYNLGVERGAGGARNRILDRSREDIDRSREQSGVFDPPRRSAAAPETKRYRAGQGE